MRKFFFVLLSSRCRKIRNEFLFFFCCVLHVVKIKFNWSVLTQQKLEYALLGIWNKALNFFFLFIVVVILLEYKYMYYQRIFLLYIFFWLCCLFGMWAFVTKIRFIFKLMIKQVRFLVLKNLLLNNFHSLLIRDSSSNIEFNCLHCRFSLSVSRYVYCCYGYMKILCELRDDIFFFLVTDLNHAFTS